MYSAGELSKRIIIKKELNQNDWIVTAEEDIITKCWAKITPISGRAYWEAQAQQSQITHEIVIRYKNNIDATMIVEYKGRKFDIDSVININEANRYLKIMAKERC